MKIIEHTLEQALKQGFSACNERVKNRPKSDFRKSSSLICKKTHI